MNTKQLTYPTIEEQQQYWIDKEAQQDSGLTETQSNNATTETGHAHPNRVNLAGAHFRVRRYNCVWIVLRYHRAGNWVCQEPDHGTTCEFHENEIMPNRLFQPVSPNALFTPEQFLELAHSEIDASNPIKSDSTTADPKPEDIGGNELPDRIEANEDFCEVERNDFDRGDLRDEGRNDGYGESYAERNQ